MKKINVGLFGDFIFNRKYLNFPFFKLNPNNHFSSILNLTQNNDFNFANLESPIFKDGKPIRENTGPLLYSKSKDIINICKYLNINILGLSNNHIDNFGQCSINKTISCLNENNIKNFGAGSNDITSKPPLIISKNNLKVAFLAYTAGKASFHDIGSAISDKNTAGCNDIITDQIIDDISIIKQKVNQVIVSLHWGYEYFRYPSPEQRLIAKRLIDCGADLVFGHHPHCHQGIETYKRKKIIYSLGNFFLFNYQSMIQPNYCNEGLYIGLEIYHDKIDINHRYFHMDNYNNLKVYENLDLKKPKFSEKFHHDNYREFWNNYYDSNKIKLFEIQKKSKYSLFRIMKGFLRILFNVLKIN